MKKIIPIQLAGLVTVGVFVFFMFQRHSIPLFRRLNLAQTITFLGILMATAMIGGIYSFGRKDASFRKAFGILNLIIAVLWGVMIYGSMTFPAQQ